MIDRSFFVQLQGRDFVLFAGLLDAATNAGLTSVITTPLQLPSEENGHMAVVKARIEFADGRAFEAMGDASPQSVGRMILPHLIRMAETRSVGRAFRWALNIGATMKEELGGDDEDARGAPAAAARTNGSQNPPRAPAPAADGAAAARCAFDGCGVELTRNQRTMSQHKVKMDLCPVHLKEMEQSAK